jgi:phosphate butyryltransferase
MYPTLEQKKGIIQNAVDVLLSLGYEKPKVGVLAAVEKVNPKMPETVDAAELKKMAESGEITNCIVEGPISYDIAMNRESAEIKEFDSPVVEDVDVLIPPNIATGNILAKALIYSGNAKMAGIIVGAKVPIILTSRGSSSEEKYLSIVLATAANMQ